MGRGGFTLPKQRRHIDLYRWQEAWSRFSFTGLDEVELLADESLYREADL